MKLLTKTSLYFIGISLFVFILGGISIYFMLQSVMREEIDEFLREQQESVLLALNNLDDLNLLMLPKDGDITLLNTSAVQEFLSSNFSDTLLYSSREAEFIPYRQLKFLVHLKGQTALITLRKSLIESDDLLETIIYSFVLLLMIMVFFTIFLNYLSIHYLWRPFHRIMELIKTYDFRAKNRFDILKTNTQEFKLLNIELEKMTAKLARHYSALKEFSENASHEMQTPLAIIQSKLELLLQQKGTEEEDLNSIQAAYQAANRLSRLHKELNLLTKIDNDEFIHTKPIHLKEVLENQIENFSDIIELKKIELQTDLNADPVINGNEDLIKTMLSNLIHNAIKHNTEHGIIKIRLEQASLFLSNTGPQMECPPDELFERFRKGKPTGDSTGLGLSIVKQIILIHQFAIQYTYNDLHNIHINF